MKKILVSLTLLLALTSCQKQVSSVTSQQSDELTTDVVTFYNHTPTNVFLSPGVNTLQSDSFYVQTTVYPVKLQFVLKDNTSRLGKSFKFYLNGSQIPTTISASGDTITVAFKKAVPLTSVTTYILQGSVYGHQSQFSIALTNAYFVDSNRLNVLVGGLPQAGNSFKIN